jgi:hypothetical protein
MTSGGEILKRETEKLIKLNNSDRHLVRMCNLIYQNFVSERWTEPWLVLPPQATGNSCARGNCKHNHITCCTKAKSKQKLARYLLSMNINTPWVRFIKFFLNLFSDKTTNSQFSLNM